MVERIVPEKITSRFEKVFTRNGEDGMQMQFECAPHGGGVVLLKNLATGNWVQASINWDGEIRISSATVFPMASIDINRVVIHQPGKYDEIEMKAYLKERVEEEKKGIG